VEVAQACEAAGAAAITVHGRTRDQMYAPPVDLAGIRAVKAALHIPVIANGGVFSKADGERLMKETGAAGIMVARAALFDPQIFVDFAGLERESKRTMFEKQMAETRALFDERFTTVFMRKMAAFYVKGERGAAAFKERLFTSQTPDETLAIVREIWN
jgi:tRNA-dihydrouridine synthase B